MDLKKNLSPHFTLGEFLPPGLTVVPVQVEQELTDLCVELLEPIRLEFGPLIIHSGYRPVSLNSSVGGVRGSDHTRGKAADFHVMTDDVRSWEDLTQAAYHWAVENLSGKYGQVILEDHRQHYDSPGKLWVHISTPSAKHPGTMSDRNSTLVSWEPGKYEPYRGGSA